MLYITADSSSRENLKLQNEELREIQAHPFEERKQNFLLSCQPFKNAHNSARLRKKKRGGEGRGGEGK